MFLPVRCPVCHGPGGAPCPRCRGALRPAPDLPPPPGVDAVVALLAYEGVGRELVARLKYRNERACLGALAAGVAALAPTALRPAPTPVTVTWAPTTAARRGRRGFDHAELLARAVARRLRLPCRPLLRRSPGPPQTGRSAAARRGGPRLEARRPVAGTVVVVDDVVTTGATLSAAAAALRAAGAARVVALAAARTPAPLAAPAAVLHSVRSTAARDVGSGNPRLRGPHPPDPSSRPAGVGAGWAEARHPPRTTTGEETPWT